jgi:hypothetical protein
VTAVCSMSLRNSQLSPLSAGRMGLAHESGLGAAPAPTPTPMIHTKLTRIDFTYKLLKFRRRDAYDSLKPSITNAWPSNKLHGRHVRLVLVVLVSVTGLCFAAGPCSCPGLTGSTNGGQVCNKRRSLAQLL